MNLTRLTTMSAASFVVLVTHAALASEATQYPLGPTPTIEQAASMLHYSGGNDLMRVEIAPNYSEELGFSLKGAVGSYLTDEIALGLIVEYGENKQEYLANAGIQFTDALSFVGTVGLLEENNEYVDGAGREEVRQMEYGASLKGAYEIGIISGFELNGYLTNADADSASVETGKLYGVQLLADIDLTGTTHFKLGGGYEWLEWQDTGEDDNRWAASAEIAQQLGDTLSLTGHAKLGASEYVYGGGLAYDLGNGGLNTNSLAVNYSYIDGRNGIEDDQRVELSWSIGFGAGPTIQTAAADLADKSGTIRAAADVALVSPANNLIGDVMKRPTFLPERVLARAKGQQETSACASVSVDADINDPVAIPHWFYVTVSFPGSQPGIQFGLTSSGTVVLPESITVTGLNGQQFVVPGDGDSTYRYYMVETGEKDTSDSALAAAFPLNSVATLDLGVCTMDATVTEVINIPL